MIEFPPLPAGRRVEIAGAPPGFDALAIAAAAAAPGGGRTVVFVARDAARAAQVVEALAFFAPGLPALEFPAWDCLPYDRVSPVGDVVSRRIATLADLARAPVDAGRQGRVVVTTVNAALQRVPPRGMFAAGGFRALVGERVQVEQLTQFLARNGYLRSDTVREPGDYALRGGIIDIFPPGTPQPLRLDLFGDTLEAIRRFDPTTQVSADRLGVFTLEPVSEVLLDAPAIERFRTGYRELFGAGGAADPLYEAVSAGRRYGGLEHWLPLFHDRLETLFDYAPGAVVALDHQSDEAVVARIEQVEEAYAARAEFAQRRDVDGPAYRPLLPERLHVGAKEWRRLLGACAVASLSPFAPSSDDGGAHDLGGRPGPGFAEARNQARSGGSVFDAVRDHIVAEQSRGRRVVVAAYSPGARDRLQSLLAEHGCGDAATIASFAELAGQPPRRIGMTVLGLERGVQSPLLSIVSEQDILGDRLIRAARRMTACACPMPTTTVSTSRSRTSTCCRASVRKRRGRSSTSSAASPGSSARRG